MLLDCGDLKNSQTDPRFGLPVFWSLRKVIRHCNWLISITINIVTYEICAGDDTHLDQLMISD